MDTYEKKYDKALLKARDAKQNTESAVTIGIIEEIFPELKESEDEKIKDILSWLEKQGQKPTWSEDNEVKINRIIACLENLNVADNDILLKDIDWLKLLKERIGG